MSVQLFVKAPGDLTYRRLDLFPTEPIKLTLSVANIEDPLAANSVFSRTFKVPHTGQNGPFFKAVFNVNSTDFDASKKADAYINDNGVFFATGNIRLLSISVNEKQDDVQYEINFYGETSDFGSKIGGGFLNQVDLSPYNHTLNYNNVVNSWTGNLLSGNVVYPLIEWGYSYNTNGTVTQGTMSLYDGTTSQRGFISQTANADRAIDYKQLKPVLKAKALWDAIFAETGYVYESTFLETDPLFTNLYVVAENEARTELVDDLRFEALQDYTDTIEMGCNGPTSVLPTTVDGKFSQEISDPSNSYSPISSVYTAASPGTYQFNITGYTNPVFSGPFSSTAFLVKIVDTITNVVLSTSSPQIVISAASFTKTLNVSLAIGQSVKLQFENIGPTGNNNDYLAIIDSTYSIPAGTGTAPSLVVMSSFMPSNIRKIDFMRSIINRFRLVFVPSKENEKKFEITPWKDWVLQGTQKDWTTKLDGSKDMKITPLFYGQERLQVYKDQEDADFVNYNYQLDYKQTYGQKNLDSNNELIKGTKTILDQFAPMPLWPIGNVEPNENLWRFVIPHIAKDTDKARLPIQPKLRIGYYNGLQNVPTVPAGYQQGWYILNQTGTPTLRPTYPLISQYSTWPVTSSTFDLSWENEAPLYETESLVPPMDKNVTGFDCFNVFWKTWYDTMFDPFSRIVEANFVLSYQDILDLKFNDYIFVKDAWYLVNKVTDYVIGSETNCRVELVKVGGNIGLVIPPNTTVYKQKELCFGTTPCEAYCCTYQIGQYYTDTIDFDDATVIYNDALGTIPAGNGYYSDGTRTVQTINGTIIQDLNPICNCNPPDLYPYTVCPGTTSCAACCCENATITVWGTSNVDLASSLNVYLDSAGTIPATGWYKQSGQIAPNVYSVRVVAGVTQAIGICSTCNCNPIIVHPHQAVYKSSESSLCAVCCDTTEITIYTDSEVFSDSTEVYIDNVPLTKGGAGFWRDKTTNTVLITDSNGDVTTYANCDTCECDFYYIGRNCNDPGLLARFTSAVELQIGDVVDSTSYANQCWEIIQIGTVPGEPVDNVYVDCAACAVVPPCTCMEYDVSSISGGAISYIDCDTEEVVYMDIAPATSYLVCACAGSVIAIFGKITIVERGECGAVVYYPLDAEYFGNEASGCTICCETDGSPITIYGDHETMATSTVVYGDAEGTTSVLPGYYKDRSGNTYYVDISGNISAFNCGGCPPCPAGYDILVGSTDLKALEGNSGELQVNYSVGSVTDMVVENDVNKIMTAGTGIVRLNQNGTVDNTFDSTSMINQPAYGIAKIDTNYYFAGAFTTSKGFTVNRLGASTLDGGYLNMPGRTTGFTASGAIMSLTSRNGFLYVYRRNRNASTYNGTPCKNLLKMDTEGNIITQYEIGTAGVIVPPVFDSTGNIYVVIQSGAAAFSLVKFTDAGTQLTSVNLGTTFVRGLAIDSANNLYLAASEFITYGGVDTARSMIKVNSNLVYDNTFLLPTKNWRNIYLKSDTLMYAAYVESGELVGRVKKIDLQTQQFDDSFVSPTMGTNTITFTLDSIDV